MHKPNVDLIKKPLFNNISNSFKKVQLNFLQTLKPLKCPHYQYSLQIFFHLNFYLFLFSTPHSKYN